MDDAPLRVTTARRGRRGRLSRRAEFERAYRHGRGHGNRYFVVYAFARDAAGDARMGLSVSRKVGGAVERNGVKRLLREAFAAEAALVPAGRDVVIVARPEARELAEREGLGGVRRELRELLERASAGT